MSQVKNEVRNIPGKRGNMCQYLKAWASQEDFKTEGKPVWLRSEGRGRQMPGDKGQPGLQ